jgi:hypothetical protein
MKPNTFLAGLVIAASLASAGVSQAATVAVNVYAQDHSVILDKGADTGIALTKGKAFTVSADEADLWRIGTNLPRHEGNAEGMVKSRLYELFGATFNHGTLVGRIGGGAYFKIGTLFSGIAQESGVLRLFAWDINSGDNSGFITAKIDVAAVPLPAGAPLLLAGLAALGLLRRRKA